MQDVLSVSLSMAPTASRKLLSPPKLAFVPELLKQQASKDHLIPSTHWMAKVEQLFIQSQLKHGTGSIEFYSLIPRPTIRGIPQYAGLPSCSNILPPPTPQEIILLMYFAAVIIAGRPATGKSSALNTVVSTLNAIQGSASSNIKLVKIYPDTYESLSELYGCVSSPGGEWVDGIFTSAFRKAHKVRRLL